MNVTTPRFAPAGQRLFVVAIVLMAGMLLGSTLLTAVAMAQENITIRWRPTSRQVDMDTLFAPMAEEYMRLNPHITIELEFLSGPRIGAENYMIEYAAGGAPDVINLPSREAMTMWYSGIAMDLRPYADRDLAAVWDDFVPEIVGEYEINGVLAGMPFRWSIGTLGANLDLLNEGGIVVDDRTWTFDDYRDIGLKLALDLSGDGQRDRFLGNPSQHWAWVWGYGGDYLDESATSCALNTPQGIAGFDAWASLTYRDGLHNPNLSGSGGFYAEQHIFFKNASGVFAVTAEENANFNWDVFFYPEGPAGKWNRIFSDGWFVHNQVQHPEEVWRFVRWLVTDGAHIQARGGGATPISRTVTLESWLQTPRQMKWLEAVQWGRQQPFNQAYPEFNSILGNYRDRIRDGEMAPEIGIEQMCREIDVVLAPFRN